MHGWQARAMRLGAASKRNFCAQCKTCMSISLTHTWHELSEHSPLLFLPKLVRAPGTAPDMGRGQRSEPETLPAQEVKFEFMLGFMLTYRCKSFDKGPPKPLPNAEISYANALLALARQLSNSWSRCLAPPEPMRCTAPP